MNSSVEEFCHFLESVCWAQDIPDWDMSGASLEITGLGDPLPATLSGDTQLALLVDSAREITATQIFGAFDRKSHNEYILNVLEISNYEAEVKLNLDELLKYRLERHNEWGGIIAKEATYAWTTRT